MSNYPQDLFGSENRPGYRRPEYSPGDPETAWLFNEGQPPAWQADDAETHAQDMMSVNCRHGR